MKQTSITINRSAGAVSTALALAANSDRNGFVIQNLAAAVLYVRLGSAATTLNFDYVLQAGTGATDGKGGVLDNGMMGSTVYMGNIYVAAVGTPNYVAFDL